MATKSSCVVCTRRIDRSSRLKPATDGSAIGLTTPPRAPVAMLMSDGNTCCSASGVSCNRSVLLMRMVTFLASTPTSIGWIAGMLLASLVTVRLSPTLMSTAIVNRRT